VTAIAACRRVCTAQREMRIARVIERRFLPAAFVVTLLTFIAVSAAMHIVQGVARHASLRRIFVALAGMTRTAAGLLMTALQRELRFIVIEARLLPRARIVAGFALLPERTAMAIIGAVAAVTRAVRRTVFFTFLVAARTGKVGVFAFEFEIGGRVIEGIAIETDDIGIATFMVGVALLARQRGLMIEFAVKTALLRDIGRDHIVALHAQLILCLLGE